MVSFDLTWCVRCIFFARYVIVYCFLLELDFFFRLLLLLGDRGGDYWCGIGWFMGGGYGCGILLLIVVCFCWFLLVFEGGKGRVR